MNLGASQAARLLAWCHTTPVDISMHVNAASLPRFMHFVFSGAAKVFANTTDVHVRGGQQHLHTAEAATPIARLATHETTSVASRTQAAHQHLPADATCCIPHTSNTSATPSRMLATHLQPPAHFRQPPLLPLSPHTNPQNTLHPHTNPQNALNPHTNPQNTLYPCPNAPQRVSPPTSASRSWPLPS